MKNIAKNLQVPIVSYTEAGERLRLLANALPKAVQRLPRTTYDCLEDAYQG